MHLPSLVKKRLALGKTVRHARTGKILKGDQGLSLAEGPINDLKLSTEMYTTEMKSLISNLNTK